MSIVESEIASLFAVAKARSAAAAAVVVTNSTTDIERVTAALVLALDTILDALVGVSMESPG